MAPKKQLYFILIFFILIIGILAIKGHTIFSTATNIDGCQFVEPLYDNIICERSGSTTTSNFKFEKLIGYYYGDENVIKNNNYKDYIFGVKENTPEATTIVYCDVDGKSRFHYQLSGDNNCDIGNKENYLCKADITRNKNTVLPNIKAGEIIRIYGCEDIYGGHGGELKFSYTPYRLVLQKQTGERTIQDSLTCDLVKSSLYKSSIFDAICISGDFNKICGTNIYMTANNKDISKSYVLGWGDWINYYSGVRPAIDDPELNARVVRYNNELVYCEAISGGKANLEKIITFKTISGNCYKAPDRSESGIIKTVQCCPGARMANAVCGDDFIWATQTMPPENGNKCQSGYEYSSNSKKCEKTTSCTLTSQCYGGGNFVTDYGATTPTKSKYNCVNGKCVIVKKEIVECTTNSDCRDGVCDVNTNKCVSGRGVVSAVCGDGICTAGLENIINCPSDCAKDKENIISNLLFFILFAAFGGFLFYAIARDVIWAVIGLIVGLAVALIVQWVLVNWVVLLLGSTLVGLAGGVVLYFFGGVIIIIIGIIVQIIGLMRNK